MRATSRDSEHIWKAIGGLVWVNHRPPGIFDAVGVQQSSTLRGSSATVCHILSRSSGGRRGKRVKESGEGGIYGSFVLRQY